MIITYTIQARTSPARFADIVRQVSAAFYGTWATAPGTSGAELTVTTDSYGNAATVFAEALRAALTARGIPFDLWVTGRRHPVPAGQPVPGIPATTDDACH